MGTLYRAQILLETEQHQRLAEIAQSEGRSISDLVREIVHQYLQERQQEAQLQRELQAINALSQTRLRLQEQHGVYHLDLLAQARAGREHDVERVWRGEE